MVPGGEAVKPGPAPTTMRGTVAGKRREVRLSPAEDAAAVAEAARFGLTVAEWFRSLIPMPTRATPTAPACPGRENA